MSIIKVPVTLISLAGEQPFTLTWPTSVQADDYVALALGRSPEVGGVRFNLERPISVDGRATAKNMRLASYMKGRLNVKVCHMGCADRGFECLPQVFVKLENLPGMLHSVASQVLSLKELLMIEEAPFQSSGSQDVGLFVNQAEGRKMWQANCRTWRSAWTRGFLRNVGMHVLCGTVECWQPRGWAQALAEASPLLRGFHFRGRPGGEWARPKMRDAYNYLHKVYSMGEIAREHAYSYILSFDDDVLLPASTIAYLANAGESSRAQGCGVVSPLLQNGVPMTELWAEEFLTPHERRRLFECFEGSQIRGPCDARHEVVEALLPKGWDGPTYYRTLAAYAKGKETGPLNYRLVGHPVRFNNTCGALALGLALEHVPHEWLRWRSDHALIVDRERRYPYLSNNAFLMAAPLYMDVLTRLEMRWGNATGHFGQPRHTCEEQLVNKVTKLHGLYLCFVSGSFGIHPAYNTQAGKEFWEDWAVQRVLETLKSHRL
ncbi:unnamed protein product [Symbiodinium natans]|uniref:Uncharacterized protein n=1 Tax=Symbiodinium natans TaxID=878477 RepID=A0A812QN13_9DINO|nr:unnamed protein product [Symbiodinium natans]